ncbi:hypothetical protein ACFOZ5_07475 [Marinobacter lacisalsi]|uniref:Uncharacterized protein n=1 Tax=Marinobacter lacisalsi TaxID=475979 RepID=A0ABV8QIF5_9GAMM
MNDMYLTSVTKNIEKFPMHDEVQRTGGFAVSDTQFVVKEQGLNPEQVTTQLNERYGVEIIVEPLSQELIENFFGTGLQAHIEQYWS